LHGHQHQNPLSGWMHFQWSYEVLPSLDLKNTLWNIERIRYSLSPEFSGASYSSSIVQAI